MSSAVVSRRHRNYREHHREHDRRCRRQLPSPAGHPLDPVGQPPLRAGRAALPAGCPQSPPSLRVCRGATSASNLRRPGRAYVRAAPLPPASRRRSTH
ncbi:Os09g0129101 [Oryza sativa Japonica Group]|uniref:Os09g0129101 protein n=1 Tax=Oryza sativa subsp. japonica TaxID=39947 RepID=A0A0P0XJ30_ORYSJ|nr:Os09g0129101 [Oryza sativa Japonica Group]